MHIYMITRGIYDKVRDFTNDLQAQYLSYGKNNEGRVQLAVRPIQLWEIVFPKQHYPVIANTLFPEGLPQRNSSDSRYSRLDIAFKLFQKGLKLKPMIPFDPKTTPRIMVRKDCVATIPLGIKEDKIWEEPKKAVLNDGNEIDLGGQEEL